MQVKTLETAATERVTQSDNTSFHDAVGKSHWSIEEKMFQANLPHRKT